MMTNNIETEKFTIAEVSNAELRAPSGVVDEVGREISNEQIIRDIYEAQGYRVWPSMNGVLSPEAKRANSEITRNPDLSPRQRAGAYIVAIRAERPLQ